MAVGCTNVLGIQRCICSDNGYVKIIIDNVHYFEVFLYVHYHMSFDSAVFFLHRQVQHECGMVYINNYILDSAAIEKC